MKSIRFMVIGLVFLMSIPLVAMEKGRQKQSRSKMKINIAAMDQQLAQVQMRREQKKRVQNLTQELEKSMAEAKKIVEKQNEVSRKLHLLQESELSDKTELKKQQREMKKIEKEYWKTSKQALKLAEQIIGALEQKNRK